MSSEPEYGMLLIPVLPHIATYVDIETLSACCCTCVDWYNELHDNGRLWKQACINYDLGQISNFPRFGSNWKESALIYLRRLSQMRKSQCFRDRSIRIESHLHRDDVVAIDYYDDEIAVATYGKVDIYLGMTFCASDISPISTILTETSRVNASVKIYKVVVLVGTTTGQVCVYMKRRWDTIPCCELSNNKRRSRLNSFYFDEICKVVVASYQDDALYLWKCIRLPHCTPPIRIPARPSGIQTVKTVPALTPRGTPDQNKFHLFCMQMDCLKLWTAEIKEGRISLPDSPRLISLNSMNSRRISVPITLIANVVKSESGMFVYHPQLSNDVRSSVIEEFDLQQGRHSGLRIHTTDGIKVLLAVGRKYIAYQTAGQDGGGEKVCVVEKTSGKLIARYDLPDDIRTHDSDCEKGTVVVCDRQWLDGLDSTNDRGLFLAYIRSHERVHFVEWIPDEEL